MRTSRLLTAAALAAAAAALTAAPSYAGKGGSGGLEVYPANATAGATVTVNTTACGASRAAAGDASAVGAGTFMLAPGSQAKDAVGRFQVPPSAPPGTYEIVAKCSGGGQVTGDLTVALASSSDQALPKGHVKTGVGGALGTDPVKTAAGVAALAVAAAGGTWLLHRRARGEGI
ncbi:hypothetical protein CG723_04155 [Streptomyces sp. CB01635]|uniref:hypothetical protein n=1 Tax=unclassified Streptomyces TaxID=2593676 RepID=UPI000C2700B6|nr:hypothetical protein [Streptomyces sp. CB01635]PJN12263.1 hypothetical protein CG723_04155 [Streptomyces sp. CB01635]